MQREAGVVVVVVVAVAAASAGFLTSSALLLRRWRAKDEESALLLLRTTQRLQTAAFRAQTAAQLQQTQRAISGAFATLKATAFGKGKSAASSQRLKFADAVAVAPGFSHTTVGSSSSAAESQAPYPIAFLALKSIAATEFTDIRQIDDSPVAGNAPVQFVAETERPLKPWERRKREQQQL